jgi:hypothetical protein
MVQQFYLEEKKQQLKLLNSIQVHLKPHFLGAFYWRQTIKTTVKDYAILKNISKTEASRILNRIVKKKITVKEMQTRVFNSYEGSKHSKIITYYYIDD